MITQVVTLPVRHLVFILGDQLSLDSAALSDFDPHQDLIVMAEVADEATTVWNHKARLVFFLSAMRHFAAALRERGYPCQYYALETHIYPDLKTVWAAAISSYQPNKVIAVEPGEWRVREALQAVCADASVPLALREDTHFFCSRADFSRWAQGKKTWLLESFYRQMRQQTGYLMVDGKPVGGQWNLDAENRGSFGQKGPGFLPAPVRFPPDTMTQQVIAIVEQTFPQHPGHLENFAWPVTAVQAQQALQDFIAHRLPSFGLYQDAMWQDEPFLYHALLSPVLNVKLLNPRTVLDAVVAAYEAKQVPLAAAEGFVRQILGWREFIRGVYWQSMPALASENYFVHETSLPKWFWTGQTEMQCVRQTIQQTLAWGYAHHIQRLMVTGNFALLAGLAPAAVSAWYRAVYVDAVEWVEMPNTLGMALYANGGRFTTKPYIASGAYIKRMSNYCGDCRYRPELKTGEQACPFTTLYWDFLARHEALLKRNPRMALPLKNLTRLQLSESAIEPDGTPSAERQALRTRAIWLKANLEKI